MQRRRLALPLALLPALACCSCGGTVAKDSANEAASTGGSGGGSQGSGGSSGSAGSSGSSAGGGLGGGGGSGASAGSGGKTCFRAEDHFGAKFATSAAVQPPVCNVTEWTEPQKWSATGIVVASSANTLQINECSPAANCAPITTDVLWDGRDLALVVPVGAIVRVDYVIMPTWYACTQVLSIVNLPSWDGIANPVSANQELYLAAADGTYQAPDGSGFTITPVALGCQSKGGGCGGTSLATDEYALAIGAAGGGTLVGMGETLALGQGLTAANLRSYVSGACDDYWNWAYWVSRQ